MNQEAVLIYAFPFLRLLNIIPSVFNLFSEDSEAKIFDDVRGLKHQAQIPMSSIYEFFFNTTFL